MNKNRFRKLLLGDFTIQRFLRSLLIIYLILALYIFFRADSMMFFPQPSSYQDDSQIIKLISRHNQQISARYLPNVKAKYTILYAHGNAEDLGDIKPVLAYLNQLGFNVFAYDYQGYGTSQGKPSEKNAYQDIQAAYNYLTQQLKIPRNRIIAYGRSIGGGSAVYLAFHQPLAGLILESTFTSAFRVVLPFPLFPFDKFTNLKKLKKIKIPTLIIHGTNDQVIPFNHGQKLFKLAPEPKLFLAVEGADHNDLLLVAGKDHAHSIKNFIDLLE